MDNLPKFCLSRNGAYPKFKVLVHFWLDQVFRALLHFRSPSFLLMILVLNFMLIKNHIETWVLKSTETELFTSKVLESY